MEESQEQLIQFYIKRIQALEQKVHEDEKIRLILKKHEMKGLDLDDDTMIHLCSVDTSEKDLKLVKEWLRKDG